MGYDTKTTIYKSTFAHFTDTGCVYNIYQVLVYTNI